jgi:hypothetical protein
LDQLEQAGTEAERSMFRGLGRVAAEIVDRVVLGGMLETEGRVALEAVVAAMKSRGWGKG